jgi:hypothetical protein
MEPRSWRWNVPSKPKPAYWYHRNAGTINEQAYLYHLDIIVWPDGRYVERVFPVLRGWTRRPMSELPEWAKL